MNNFTSEFFNGNRKRISEALLDSLILIPAHSLLQSSADTPFPFRQDSNFWYLTGLDEPNLVLSIDTNSGRTNIFLPEQNDYQKLWDGELKATEYQNISGITEFLQRSDLRKQLVKAKKQGLQICYLAPLPELVEPYGFYSNPARRTLETEIKLIEPKPKDIRLELARLRQIKQPIEIEALQKAIDITTITLKDVKTRLADFKTEKEIERALSAGFFNNGADGHGYEPIVASGKNATTIHYMRNNDSVDNKSMILLDVGACVGYYSADISRTWSIVKPSPRQLEVFEAVEELQNRAYSLLKPGVLIKEYQKTMEEEAAKTMKNLGVTKKQQYPHGFSHFLGLDVHDAGDYDAPLKENSVMTVEPGIYLPEEGIGVRIEDDVFITKTGIKILSKNIPTSL